MKIVTEAGYHGFVGIEYEGRPAERARGNQGDQEAARVDPGKLRRSEAWRVQQEPG